MAVYVDKANIPYGRMRMSHMIADSIEELHEMADRIGLNRRWFQANASFPHYDVSISRRATALNNGAINVSRRELVRIMGRLREAPKPAEKSPA